MPEDARPQPLFKPIEGTVHYRREYVDSLGRPLVGTVVITGRGRSDINHVSILASAPVTVPIPAGRLDVDLPPGMYEIKATLKSADNARVLDSRTVTLG